MAARWYWKVLLASARLQPRFCRHRGFWPRRGPRRRAHFGLAIAATTTYIPARKSAGAPLANLVRPGTEQPYRIRRGSPASTFHRNRANPRDAAPYYVLTEA